MYEVWLMSFPADDKNTFARVVRKQQRHSSDNAITALLSSVSGGEARCIRALPVEDAAEHLVSEIKLHGGDAEVRETQA